MEWVGVQECLWLMTKGDWKSPGGNGYRAEVLRIGRQGQDQVGP
jgi:hypothetical protein